MRVRETNPPTPGDVLREILETQIQITQDEFAAAIRVSRYSVNQLVNGRRGITADMALRLAKALDTTPDFWLNLQRAADLASAQRLSGSEIAKIPRLRHA